MSVLLTMAVLAIPTHTPAAAVAQHASAVWDGVRHVRAEARLRRAWRRHSERVAARRRAEATRMSQQSDTTTTSPSYESPPTSYVGSNAQAICQVFGDYCDQAIRVAACESGGGDPLAIDTNAANGQYLGAFQFGEYARSVFGFGPDIWTQAWAAYAYFAASGYRWTAWECQP